MTFTSDLVDMTFEDITIKNTTVDLLLDVSACNHFTMKNFSIEGHRDSDTGSQGNLISIQGA